MPLRGTHATIDGVILTSKDELVESAPAQSSIRLQILTLAVVRIILNTGFRMVYPFLPVIATGLGVGVSEVAQAITARSLVGFFSPLLGSIADVWGRRAAMLVGLTIYSGGLLLVTLWPTYPALFASLIAAAVGKIIFETAVQAFVGDRVAYSQRGLALAITEMSWSASFLIGIPLVGWLIARTGDWRAPFPWLTAMGLAIVLIVWRMLPADAPHPDTRPSFLRSVRFVATHRPALGGLAVGLLISSANEAINIVYGAWLHSRFALPVTFLGVTAIVIGAAELSGEGFVATLTDRIGKRRAIALGLTLNIAASLAMPYLGAQVSGALIGLFLFYLTFEFALVSSIPLMTELVPTARATMMAGLAAFISLGRAFGALLGDALFTGIGLQANSIAAAAINVLAIVILLALVKQE